MSAQNSVPSGESEKSPWAEAIGPLYSEEYLMGVFGYSADEIDALILGSECFWIEAAQGERLFPVDQFNHDGQVHAAAKELAQALDHPDILGNYMKTAWLNRKKRELEEDRPWDTIVYSPEELDPRLRMIANRMISRMSQ